MPSTSSVAAAWGKLDITTIMIGQIPSYFNPIIIDITIIDLLPGYFLFSRPFG
jgi:hypothetical protein